ncbi:NUDIX hydrolase [Sphingomonas sp.]|uniref:NUDIX hydrolase n=1 Tax=Sphingomonas sp. TaxID=28214 RepID=UPI00286D0F0C|nr:NUDIX hydrolase [Sphingomonas sp.]
MSDELEAPAKIMWQGKYIRALTRGRWEYVSRVGDVRAVVIFAEFEGKVILIDQTRVALGGRCLELPAGLVGDEDPGATIEDTAVKELEEEASFTASSVERLGDFHASPGMLSEGFTLVRAHGVRPTGVAHEEDIVVHLVPRADIPAFIEQKRAEGFAIDVKLLIFLNF